MFVTGLPQQPHSEVAAKTMTVITIFFNSLWAQPTLFFEPILSVGKPVAAEKA